MVGVDTPVATGDSGENDCDTAAEEAGLAIIAGGGDGLAARLAPTELAADDGIALDVDDGA